MHEVDLQQLRAAARAAESDYPGEWEAIGRNVFGSGEQVVGALGSKAMANYLSSVRPGLLLALVAELESARAARD